MRILVNCGMILPFVSNDIWISIEKFTVFGIGFIVALIIFDYMFTVALNKLTALEDDIAKINVDIISHQINNTKNQANETRKLIDDSILSNKYVEYMAGLEEEISELKDAIVEKTIALENMSKKYCELNTQYLKLQNVESKIKKIKSELPHLVWMVDDNLVHVLSNKKINLDLEIIMYAQADIKMENEAFHTIHKKPESEKMVKFFGALMEIERIVKDQ